MTTRIRRTTIAMAIGTGLFAAESAAFAQVQWNSYSVPPDPGIVSIAVGGGLIYAAGDDGVWFSRLANKPTTWALFSSVQATQITVDNGGSLYAIDSSGTIYWTIITNIGRQLVEELAPVPTSNMPPGPDSGDTCKDAATDIAVSGTNMPPTIYVIDCGQVWSWNQHPGQWGVGSFASGTARAIAGGAKTSVPWVVDKNGQVFAQGMQVANVPPNAYIQPHPHSIGLFGTSNPDNVAFGLGFTSDQNGNYILCEWNNGWACPNGWPYARIVSASGNTVAVFNGQQIWVDTGD